MKKLLVLVLMSIFLCGLVLADQTDNDAASLNSGSDNSIIQTHNDSEDNETKTNETDDDMDDKDDEDDDDDEADDEDEECEEEDEEDCDDDADDEADDEEDEECEEDEDECDTEDSDDEVDDEDEEEYKERSLKRAIASLRRNIAQGKASAVSIAARQRVIAKLQERIQERENETEREEKKEHIKKLNIMRARLHTLLELENATVNESIGRQVAAVAREFDNSINKTAKAEEKIRKRNAFVKFFIGGQKKEAELIEAEIEANKAKLEKLKELQEMTEEEIRAFIAEQIAGIEAEQARLAELAKNEKARKGIFGWLFG